MEQNHGDDLKICRKCLQTKPRSEFNKNHSKKDGLRVDCRECQKKHFKEYASRPETKEKQRAYWDSESGRAALRRAAKKYKASEKGKESKRRYNKSETGLEAHKRAREVANELGKRRAYGKVMNAVKSGRLKRTGLCSECGQSRKTEMHHYAGYDKALIVKEICRPCHVKEHHVPHL